MDALIKQPDGSFTVQTAPDPRTGATLVTLDPLEWIHRIVAHIPGPGQHTRRLYGAYSNRSRVSAPVAQEFSGGAAHRCMDDEDSEFSRETRRRWARLLRKIFEAEPVLCSCGADMKIVSIILSHAWWIVSCGRASAANPVIPSKLVRLLSPRSIGQVMASVALPMRQRFLDLIRENLLRVRVYVDREMRAGLAGRQGSVSTTSS
jgi:hypothetical protein